MHAHGRGVGDGALSDRVLCSVAGFLCTVSTLRARVGVLGPPKVPTIRGTATAGTYTVPLEVTLTPVCNATAHSRTAAQAHRPDVRRTATGPPSHTTRIYGRRAAIRRTPQDGLEWYTLHSSTEYVEPNERRSYSYQRAVAMDLSQHREHNISDYEHITWSGTLSASSI